MATVRKRPAVDRAGQAVRFQPGRLHLVDVEYTDVSGGRSGDSVVWEREVGRTLVAPGHFRRSCPSFPWLIEPSTHWCVAAGGRL